MLLQITGSKIYLKDCEVFKYINVRGRNTAPTPRAGYTTRSYINPLAPNDVYISPTAQLTSRRCILNIPSTNILTEYFKHAAHSRFFFSLQDAVYFIMLPFFGSCNIHVLNTGCAKILKKIPVPKS